MESRWYVPPGKILRKTKIKDRKHELHVSKENWDKITGHLDRNRLMQEAQEAEEQHKQAMRETAEAMTRNWSDCLKNIKEKEKPDDEVKIAQNLEMYRNLRKEQEEERRIYVEEMRKKMNRRCDYPKALTSALLLTEIVYERDMQLELAKKLKGHADDAERKYSDEVMQDSIADANERREKKMKQIMTNRAYATELKAKIDDDKRVRKEEYEKRMKEEKQDNEHAKMEEKLLEEYEHKRCMENRATKKKDIEEQMKQNQLYKEVKKKENEETEAFAKIIQNYRDRITCLTRKKNLEAKHQRDLQATEFSKRLPDDSAHCAEKDKERLKKEIAEQDAVHDARVKADKDKRLKEKQTLTQARNDYLERVRSEKARQMEINKWQMLNNCKSLEETKKYEDGLRQNAIFKGLKTKLEWDGDLEYKRGIKDLEAEEERKALQGEIDKLQQDDDFFYEYAGDVLDFAKSRGRITYPIEKVIKGYKRNIQNLPPKPKPCAAAFNKDLVNKTPGKMAHEPDTDPTYHKSQCKCGCHKDVLFK